METMHTDHAHPQMHDRDFDAYVDRMAARFAKINQPLFRTHATGLFDLYLSALPAEDRQYHNCNTCRSFFDRFGGLVTIQSDGSLVSAVWDMNDQPSAYYARAVALLQTAVRRAKVSGIFYGPHEAQKRDGGAYGARRTSINGKPWTHFAVPVPAVLHPRHTLPAGNSIEAKEAAMNERFRTVQEALGAYDEATLARGVAWLREGGLPRAERFVAPMEWFQEAHAMRYRGNVVRHMVARAPEGYTHIRGSMIGTLLQHIQDGDDAATIKASFAEKMAPNNYQRPKAAPAEGQIEQAEKLVQSMGLEPALRRRYARLEDVAVKLWEPAPEAPPQGGVFSELRPKSLTRLPVAVTGVTAMTWVKFARDVLPTAKRILCEVPSHGDYYALVTSVDPDAPPILRWDRAEQRNPVSWYTHMNGSLAERWALRAGSRVAVTAFTPLPCAWHGALPGEAPRFLALLEGCVPQDAAGLCLFPEILRSELHGVRHVFEAYSKQKRIEQPSAATACGLLAWGRHTYTVESADTVRTIRIDRFE